jgi:hypothetical protein
MREVLVNFIKLLYQPRIVFSSLKEKPNLLIAVVLLLLVTAFYLLISTPLEAEQALAQISEGRLSEAEFVKAREMLSSPTMIAISLVAGLISTLFSWFLQGGVFYLFSTLLGGQAGFRETLVVVVYAWLPIGMRKVLQGGSMLVSGKVIGGGLGSLLSKSKELSATGVLLDSLDAFVLWNLVLLILGLKVMHHISGKKSGAIVISYWAFSAVFTIVSVLISTSLKA